MCRRRRRKKLAANESMNLFVTSALATGVKIRVCVPPVCVKTLVPV